MEHVVALLRSHGFEDVVVTVAFMANAIRNYFGDGSEFGVRMAYATEPTPLGTAGSILNAREQLDERFLVISGDVLTDMDLSAAVRAHEERARSEPSLSNPSTTPSSSGSSSPTRAGRSNVSWRSRPGDRSSATRSTRGSTSSSPRSSTSSPRVSPVDFSADVFPDVLAAGKPLFGHVSDGYWEDVGTLEAYLRAHQDVMDGKVQVDVAGFLLRPGVWLGKGAEVDPTARIDGPAIIGGNAHVGAGAHLRLVLRARPEHPDR